MHGPSAHLGFHEVRRGKWVGSVMARRTPPPPFLPLPLVLMRNICKFCRGVRVRPKLEFYSGGMQINMITGPSAGNPRAERHVRLMDGKKSAEGAARVAPNWGRLKRRFVRVGLVFPTCCQWCHSLRLFVSFHVYKRPRTGQVRCRVVWGSDV